MSELKPCPPELPNELRAKLLDELRGGYSALREVSKLRATEAELLDALETRDANVSECPVNKPSWRGGASSCPKCGLGSGHSCPVITSSDHAFVERARALITKHRT